jgi:aryl-alcohol dehydrogenase
MHARNFGPSLSDRSSTTLTSSSSTLFEKKSTDFFGQSSFCNPTTVQSSSCVKISKELDLKVVCALGCGFQKGAWGVFNVVKPVQRKVRNLAISRVGAVGCAAIMVAHHLSSRTQEPGILDKIIAIDLNKSRIEHAKELDTMHTICGSEEDVENCLKEMTQGEGVDAAIDCTGVISVVEKMVECVGVGGLAVTVGGPSLRLEVYVDVFGMLIGCKTYRGCRQGNAYSKEVCTQEMAAENEVVVKPILVWD